MSQSPSKSFWRKYSYAAIAAELDWLRERKPSFIGILTHFSLYFSSRNSGKPQLSRPKKKNGFSTKMRRRCTESAEERLQKRKLLDFLSSSFFFFVGIESLQSTRQGCFASLILERFGEKTIGIDRRIQSDFFAIFCTKTIFVFKISAVRL